MSAFFDRYRRGLDGWVLVAQILIGLFFLAAACYKIGIYIEGERTLAADFAYWAGNGWPPGWYRAFMDRIFALPLGNAAIEWTVIVTQSVAGILLVSNRGVRVAGWLLLFVQTNVFLGTYHQWNFNEFVGVSLWMSLYFVLRRPDGSWSPRARNAVIAALVGISVLYLRNRWAMGDPFPADAAWQRSDLRHDVMSAYGWIKWSYLAATGGAFGPYLWAAPWWAALACTVLLCVPRTRAAGAAGLFLLAVLRTAVWTNSITSQGVLPALMYFLWLADDTRKKGIPS
jgi:hypothetical protein